MFLGDIERDQWLEIVKKCGGGNLIPAFRTSDQPCTHEIDVEC